MKSLTFVLRIVAMVFALSWAVARASASDVFIAQSGAGYANGSNCGNALPYTYFNTSGNWGSGVNQIGPGTTVHLCGTITTPLTVLGNGTPGGAITVLFESAAQIRAICSPAAGCLNAVNKSYIIVDGGSTCGWINGTKVNCNGTISTTDSSAWGIMGDSCANCEFRNLNVGGLVGGMARGIQNVTGNAGGATFRVHNNVITYVGSAVVYVPTGSNDNGFQVYNNFIENMNSGIDISNNNNGSLTATSIHDNRFGSTAWADAPGCPGHHNSLHAFAYGTTNNNIDFFNNLITGDWGNCQTSGLYIEGNGSVNRNIRIFNNVWQATYTQANNGVVNVTAGGTIQFYNNTIMGYPPGGGTCLWIDALAGGTVSIRNNIVGGCPTVFASRTIPALLSVSNNLYYGPASSPWTNQGTPASWYSTLSAWRSACNCDGNSNWGTNSLYAALNSLGNPTAGSPAIGAGVNLTNLGIAALNSDKLGLPRPASGSWDIGAYVYQGAQVVSPPTGLSTIVR